MDDTRSLLCKLLEGTPVAETAVDQLSATGRENELEPVGDQAVSRFQDGLCLCVIHGFQNGDPLLEVPGDPTPIRAIAATCSLTADDAGQIVAVAFDRGNRERPIILGRVVAGLELAGHAPDKLLLSADQEISLRCGKTSITLNADGTVAIRGANVISRASHTNRIRGGNVQIN